MMSSGNSSENQIVLWGDAGKKVSCVPIWFFLLKNFEEKEESAVSEERGRIWIVDFRLIIDDYL